MGFFSTPKKRRSPRAVLNALERKLAKRQAKLAKKKAKEDLKRKIADARKKLRGY